MWMVTRLDVVGAIAAACFVALPQQEAPAPGIERLVERIQERYDDASIQAHFVQHRLSRLGSVMNSAEGEVSIAAPGRMRWEYAGSGQLMVVGGEGREAYLYIPADNEVHIIQTDEFTPSQYPFLYLVGRGSLRRDFRVEVVEWSTPLNHNHVQLELTPRRSGTGIERLILEVDPLQATIARLVHFDNLRNAVDYQFHDVQFDVEPPDELFEFEIPAGAKKVYVGS